MAAPGPCQFEACRKPSGRRAKIVSKKETFSDLNDQIPWREWLFSWKSMKIATPPRTNEQVREKVAVVATALTLFYFCNPSNVLRPIPSLKLIFREVNLHSRWGRLKSHLPRSKKWKTQMWVFPLVLGTFRSHFDESPSNRKAFRRADRRSLAATAVRTLVDFGFGGKWSFFGMPLTFLKTRPIHRGRWISRFCSGKLKEGPKRVGGNVSTPTAVRTRLQTFEK